MGDVSHIVCPHCGQVNRAPTGRLADSPRCGGCKQALFHGHPVELDAQSFGRTITRNDVPVVVDFWAPWCGPCKMMAPVYEQAAVQLEPQVRLAKLNTEEAPALAAQYGIRSIPTVTLFRDGKEVARQAGVMNLPQLVRWIHAHA